MLSAYCLIIALLGNCCFVQSASGESVDPNSLLLTKKLDDGKIWFWCERCQDRCYDRKSSAIRHIKVLHCPSAIFSCAGCERVFSEKYRLRTHCRSSHPEMFLKFGVESASDESVDSNKLWFTEQLDDGTVRYGCKECPGKYFKMPRNAERHVNTIHAHNTLFPCLTCGKAFGREDCLRKHYSNMHGKISVVTNYSKPPRKRIQCPGVDGRGCGVICATRQGLAAHMLTGAHRWKKR